MERGLPARIEERRHLACRFRDNVIADWKSAAHNAGWKPALHNILITMRLMALDVGKRRIGIAISDPLQITARPHSTVPRRKTSPEEIARLASELETGTILVGLPLHLNGTEGEQAKDVRSFTSKLARFATGIQIEFVDERLTSVEAEERLSDRRGSWRKKRDQIDSFAAAYILQTYLNSR